MSPKDERFSVEGLPRIDLALARELIDFDPQSKALKRESGFGHSQLTGCVQAFNMLATNRVAYLADEVGLGKTYVALGVAGLLRHLQPDVRIMYIAPRENIQRKWIKEQRNFVRNNWRVTDNRVRSIQGTPARRPVLVERLRDWVHEMVLGDRRDLFLRMTSFSAHVKRAESRKDLREWLRREIPWIPSGALSSKDPDSFRDQVGRVLNSVVPEIDLLIVDEAHNLKHGFGTKVSTRNRLMGLSLGHPEGGDTGAWWYGRRVKRLLLLSATPFESDLTDLYRQLDVFGLSDLQLAEHKRERDCTTAKLGDRQLDDEAGREIVRRFLTRRVGYLRAGGEKLTKNLYRREWRLGGFEAPDLPMQLADPRQRLVVGLVQRKVAELIGNERFGNQFQIGMLSSFESFLESVARKQSKQETLELVDEEEGAFDGRDQTDLKEERRGVDTFALQGLVHSYRDRFGTGLPHPKLDATAEALLSAFETGAKALVFVRRVATVTELASKLSRGFDHWIMERLRRALPEMRTELEQQFERYWSESRERKGEAPTEHLQSEDALSETERLPYASEDEGGTEDFFSWFFRGNGPSGVLSGAAFQKNRLSNASSAYSTLFEDNYLARVLNSSVDIPGALSEAIGKSRQELEFDLRRLAWAHYGRTWKRASSGYPRMYLFESYQAAGLWMLHLQKNPRAIHAGHILRERFSGFGGEKEDAPRSFPGPEDFIGIETFFTELRRRPELRKRLWPQEDLGSWLEEFRRSEQRRELLSAMVRLGAAFIDLWALAIRPFGTLKMGQYAERGERPDRTLALALADLLQEQSQVDGFHAFRELSDAAEAFDPLLAVNFPEVPSAQLSELPKIYSRTLQHQMPVGAMSGSVNHRLVRQFRMPGFPLVLAATDVLQEGEDLHTFCRKVVHYGIAWTPSAMEQRTGRVDRIGSLAQRTIDRAEVLPSEEDKIQVYYPHLPGTVEVLQVRRVLKRLDRFLSLVHLDFSAGGDSHSTIDTGRELLDALKPSDPPSAPLETAYPVQPAWLQGELGPEMVTPLGVEGLERHFDVMWREVCEVLNVRRPVARDEHYASGELRLLQGEPAPETTGDDDLVRRQGFDFELRSRAAGDSTLVRCTSKVGILNLGDDSVVDRVRALQRELNHVRVCATPNSRGRRQHGYEIRVERSMLFHPQTSQVGELCELVMDTTSRAALLWSGLQENEGENRRNSGKSRPSADEGQPLDEMLDCLAEKHPEWRFTNRTVEVPTRQGERKQRVRIRQVGAHWDLRTIVLKAETFTRRRHLVRDFAKRAWLRNAATNIVTFTFDKDDQLIGLIRHPAEHLDLEELELYVNVLAAECDRFEYLLGGIDVS